MKNNGIQQHPFEYISCIQNATFFRFLLFILLSFVSAKPINAQGISTFNFTLNDTLNYASLSSRAIEINGSYYVGSYGYGLTSHNGYFMITRLAADGTIESIERGYDYNFDIRGGKMVPANDGFLIGYNKVGPNLELGGEYAIIQVVKLDFNLDTVWKFTSAPHNYYDRVQDLFYCPEDNTIKVFGDRIYPDSANTNEYDALYLELSADGDSLDLKLYEDGTNLMFSSASVINQSLYVSGNQGHGNQFNSIVYKMDLNGNEISQNIYPNHYVLFLTQYSHDSYILSGTPTDMGNIKGRLILSDTNGVEIWNKLHEYESTVFDQYYSRKTQNNDIVSVGLIGLGDSPEGNSGFISRSDSLGELLWFRRYNYNSNTDFFIDILETSDSGLLVNGSATDIGAGGQNLWLVKLDSMGCLEPNCWVGLESVEPNAIGVSLFPNPANDWLNIKLHNPSQAITLELFDVSGQRVMHTQLFAPLEAIQVSHLAIGLYLAKFSKTDGNTKTERFIIER